MTISLYPSAPLPTRRPWPRRVAADLALAWAAWRARARHGRALQALDGLGDATLKDIGFADVAAERRRTIAASNFLRGL